MDSQELVDQEIDHGRALFEALLRDHSDIDAAFWSWDPDLGRWRLYVTSETAQEAGPREAYRQIQSTLSRLRDHVSIRLDTIQPIGVDDPFVKALESRVAKGAARLDTRFRNDLIDGYFVEECYVYGQSFRQARAKKGREPNTEGTAITHGPMEP